MARKSGWQQFADNFNSVYGTFKNFAKEYEAKQVMTEKPIEVMGEDNTPTGKWSYGGQQFDAKPTDQEFQRMQYKRMGDIYTKYGDWKAGLDMRTRLEDLDAKNRENSINQQILGELIYQRGEGKSQKLRSDIGLTDSQTANNYSLVNERDTLLTPRLNAMEATTADTRSQTNRRDTLLPGEVVDQAAGTDVKVANAADTRSQTNRRNTLLPGEVVDQAAGTDVKVANAADTRSQTNRRDTLLPGEVADQAAGTGLKVAQTRNTNANAEGQETKNKVDARSWDNLTKEDAIIAQAASMKFDTPDQAQEWVVGEMKKQLPPERAAVVVGAIEKMGLATLQTEGAKLTVAAENATKKGGLQGLADWYDGVNGPTSIKVVQDNTGVKVVEVGKDGKPIGILAQGANQQEVIGQMQAIVGTPSKAMELAATMATIKKTGAETSLLDSKKFSELYEQDKTQAQTVLLKAQTDKVREEIRLSKAGLGDQKKIALTGLSKMMADPNFALLKPPEQEAMRMNYMKQFGLVQSDVGGKFGTITEDK